MRSHFMTRDSQRFFPAQVHPGGLRLLHYRFDLFQLMQCSKKPSNHRRKVGGEISKDDILAGICDILGFTDGC